MINEELVNDSNTDVVLQQHQESDTDHNQSYGQDQYSHQSELDGHDDGQMQGNSRTTRVLSS